MRLSGRAGDGDGDPRRSVRDSRHRSAGSIDRHIRALERASLRNIRVRAVARMIRYRVTVAVRPPVVPEIISVHMRRKTVQAVLEEIGLQTGARVGLDLDPSRRRIAIRYGNARAKDAIAETEDIP